MWELDYKESWAQKNWCFWTVVLEKTLESPWDCKEIQPVHPKGDQSWVFIGRSDVETGTPILWPPDAKSWLIWKDPDAGKDWGQEEKGTTEDEIVGWHHQLNGHEFGRAPGVVDGQGGLDCCSSWGHKESDTTERLNWTLEYYKVIWRECCCWQVLNHVPLFAVSWAVACQAPLPMDFFQARRLEWVAISYSGVLHPGIKPACLEAAALADIFFTTSTTKCLYQSGWMIA